MIFAKIKQLANGKWIAEIREPKWLWMRRAFDKTAPMYAWEPGNMYYSCCLCDTKKEAEEVLKEGLALRGK